MRQKRLFVEVNKDRFRREGGGEVNQRLITGPRTEMVFNFPLRFLVSLSFRNENAIIFLCDLMVTRYRIPLIREPVALVDEP